MKLQVKKLDPNAKIPTGIKLIAGCTSNYNAIRKVF